VVVDVWDFMELAGSAGFMLCLVPQFLRTIKRRTAEDLSIPFLLLVLFASGVTLPTMLHNDLYIFAVSQAANILVWSTVLYFRVFPHGRRREAGGDKAPDEA